MPDVLALYVDALSSAHLDPETTPTLWAWQEAGSVSALRSLFAFKGISAAMYAGIPPAESGVWMDFKVRERPERKLGDAGLAVAARLPSGLPRKGAVVAYERLVRDSRVTPHIVPASLRPYFEAHPEASWTDERPLGDIPTIFDLCRETDRSFRTVGLSGGPQDRLMRKARSVADYDEDVVVFKLTHLDHVGHKYGPGSPEHDEALAEMDALLETVAERLSGDLLIFSDHGMQPVADAVDVRSLLTDRAGLTEGEEFVAFYSSTNALVRWLSPDARARASPVLEAASSVSLLDEDELADLAIGETAAAFADDVLATTPGVVVSPDFYRRSPPEGMHGFVRNERGGPVAIAPGRETPAAGELWDIAPTITRLAGMETPAAWTGTTLV